MRKWIVVLAFLTACSGGGGFSDQDKTDYLAGCHDSGGSEEVCNCAWDKITETWDSSKEAQDDPDFSTKVAEFGRECAAK
ncbi:MAG TPA: hypothetical protein VFK89_07280 [Actinomycetota bacterium]|nr:hypothetical protein [Actinomycetota bacterium]